MIKVLEEAIKLIQDYNEEVCSIIDVQKQPFELKLNDGYNFSIELYGFHIWDNDNYSEENMEEQMKINIREFSEEIMKFLAILQKKL